MTDWKHTSTVSGWVLMHWSHTRQRWSSSCFSAISVTHLKVAAGNASACFFKTNFVHLRVLGKYQSQEGRFSPPLLFSTQPQALVGAEGQNQGLSCVRQMPYHWVTSEIPASSALKCSHNTFHLCKRLKKKNIRVHHYPPWRLVNCLC